MTLHFLLFHVASARPTRILHKGYISIQTRMSGMLSRDFSSISHFWGYFHCPSVLNLRPCPVHVALRHAKAKGNPIFGGEKKEWKFDRKEEEAFLLALPQQQKEGRGRTEGPKAQNISPLGLLS